MTQEQRQDLFNTVVTHFAAQQQRSMGEELCLYRLKVDEHKTLKCAVGCLIPDDIYNYNIEGKEVRWIMNYTGIAEHFANTYGIRDDDDIEFLMDLQRAHDSSTTADRLRERLYTMARRLGIDDTSAVDAITSWK